jgi:hypothetical protein
MSQNVYANLKPSFVYFSETPARTIFIKHPAAQNVDGFFSTTTALMFEIYKPGSSEDMAKIISALKKDSNVEMCAEGAITGDYHMVNITLKSAKDKAWFAALFKKAGLNNIKINNNPIVEVGKM